MSGLQRVTGDTAVSNSLPRNEFMGELFKTAVTSVSLRNRVFGGESETDA